MSCVVAGASTIPRLYRGKPRRLEAPRLLAFREAFVKRMSAANFQSLRGLTPKKGRKKKRREKKKRAHE